MSAPLTVVLLAIALFLPSGAASQDPGAPADACPEGMRLVDGDHWDRVDQTCEKVKWGFCWSYVPGAARGSGRKTHERVCMDEFEGPNTPGKDPVVMLTGKEAAGFCARQGKRRCTEYEWETACEGPAMLPYGSGWSVDHAACNTGKSWRPINAHALLLEGEEARARELAKVWQGEPSGSRPACVSPYGVHDMVGNVEEWVMATRYPGHPPVLMGGHWAKPWSACRDTNFAHAKDPAFTYYEVGVRCCKDPQP